MSTAQTGLELSNPEDRALDQIMAHHAKFLSFLAARVEDAPTAEDILQSAYLKAMEHGSEIREDESTVAWFYRILRNAVSDHYRRSSARARAHQGFADQADLSYQAEPERTVCACVGDVVRELKPEYRTAIEQVDLGGATVEHFARSQQKSANNVSVRLHRARKAIAKKLTTICGACAKHKCLDCTCGRSQV